MSYGLSVKNDSQYIQIDSEMPRLCCLYEGTYAGISNITVEFPAAVTTQEPPCVFMRPDDQLEPIMNGGLEINGGPGAWTGFSMAFYRNDIWPRGTWFVAVFRSTATTQYGMRLWDASSNEIYDTGSPAVIVSSATNKIQYAGTTNVGGSAFVTHYAQLPSAIGKYDHFMINPFSRWIVVNNTENAMVGATFDYVNNRVTIYSVSLVNAATWVDIGSMGVVVARLRR